MSTNSKIIINIECGQANCAAEPGKFCSFFGTIRLGTVPVCRLFPSKSNSYTELKLDSDGWTKRCPDCLKSQAK